MSITALLRSSLILAILCSMNFAARAADKDAEAAAAPTESASASAPATPATEEAATRAPASATLEELEDDFVLTPPEPPPVATKAKKGERSMASAGARRSKIPVSISDGFELRVLYKKETSMFWVVKRDSKYDIIYASSGGSKSSVSLSPDVFRQLQSVAGSFKPVDADLQKCKDASIQLSVVATGRPEHTTTSCVGSKGADADRLRNFSQSLAAVVK